MAHENTLQLQKSALVIIDMQEAFREKIPNFTGIALRIALKAEAAKLLHFPTLITEQYRKGLGHTASEIMSYRSLNFCAIPGMRSLEQSKSW
jgi:nicotinamidase-related amidase